MSLVCLVPARGGSKGLPGKNLRTAGGVSLVGRAILAAREFARLAAMPDLYIFVDTDAEAIAAEARRWGASVPFLRSPELAGDAVPTSATTLAAIERLEHQGLAADAVVLLQPTSPLRSGGDVLACWREFDAATRPSVISVAATEHPAAIALRRRDDGVVEWQVGGAAPARRQDAGETYWPSGAVYVITAALLRREQQFIVPGVTRGVILPRARSLDVDTADDLSLAEAVLAAQPVEPLRLGGRPIGPGHPCFVIAEAGVNHNGDPAVAHRLIDVAADAGADAVKFQTFDPERLVTAAAPKAAYQLANTGATESQLAMLRRLVLAPEALEPLAAHAASRGLLFLSTPFDEGSADLLETLGVPAFKISSGEVTNHPFLEQLARKGKPLLLSTGMSTLAEVAEAVEAVRAGGGPPLALLHCVSNYPAAPAECNLRAMETMRRAFGVPVGWSDHTEGLRVSLAAVAAGASLLEKHFTLDRGLPGPDHRASLEPGELAALVTAVRETESTLGDGDKRPMASEAAIAAVVRRSVHAARALPAGHVLAEDDLVALRPGTGLPPAMRRRLVGRTLRVSVEGGEMLQEESVG